MIGEALKVEIVLYAAEARMSNEVLRAAASGTLTPARAARYLATALTLVRHTPVHLARARARALARGETELADHFARKLGEEQGHDAWAEGDLARLAQRFGLEERAEAVPAIRGLLAFLEETIDREPTLYLAYILFVEYVNVLLGPELIALAEERCGIPRTAFTVIGNHAELDVGHVEDGVSAIDDLVGDPAQLTSMRETLRTSMGWFDRLCAEVVAPEAQANTRRDSHRPAA